MSEPPTVGLRRNPTDTLRCRPSSLSGGWIKGHGLPPNDVRVLDLDFLPLAGLRCAPVNDSSGWRISTRT
jgi:hypothetical protein